MVQKKNDRECVEECYGSDRDGGPPCRPRFFDDIEQRFRDAQHQQRRHEEEQHAHLHHMQGEGDMVECRKGASKHEK